VLPKQRKLLEDQIRECEVRLQTHHARLSYGTHLLKERASSALSSKAVLLGGAALGAAAGLLLTRRGREDEWDDERALKRHRKRLKRARRLSLPELLQRWGPLLLPLVSPMLNPKLALSMAKLGIPVTVKAQKDLPTVQQLDLQRFAGHWYEISRLPNRHEKHCASDVTAEYELDGQGALVVRNRCKRADGSVDEVQGVGRLPDPAQPGQLEVSFAPAALRWFPAAWADYWVLFVDQDYTVALVGTPDRENLWILAREPKVETEDLEALKALALRHGFDVTRLVSLPHADVRADAPGATVTPLVTPAAPSATTLH